MFDHHSNRQPTGGGLVVRELYADGTPTDQYNYGGIEPIVTYKTERGADAYVERKYQEKREGAGRTPYEQAWPDYAARVDAEEHGPDMTPADFDLGLGELDCADSEG